METEKKEQTGLGVHPETSLYEQAQAGCQESLNQLMVKHEPLVLHAIKRQNLGDIPYDDAVQAGRLGLWQAILNYDLGRGHRFSTYAYPAIVHQVWAAVKAHCVANKRAHATQEWVIFFRHWEVGMAEAQTEEDVRASLNAMVKRLPERLGQVIVAYYGLAGQRPQRQREIGAQMGVTQQRIGQLKEAALVRLRHPAYSQELRELLKRHSQQEYEWAEEIAQAWLRRRGGRHGQGRN
jgi:RNA polymerase sigma factor (sigma-70 family)